MIEYRDCFPNICDPLPPVPITYTLDLNAGLTQVLSTQSGTVTTSYLYGPTRIGEQQPGGPSAGSGQAFAYHLPDALGSVRQLADASGAVTLTRSYEPFGSSTYSKDGLHHFESAILILPCPHNGSISSLRIER